MGHGGDVCCGGCDAAAQPRKLRNILKTKPDLIAAGNIGCHTVQPGDALRSFTPWRYWTGWPGGRDPMPWDPLPWERRRDAPPDRADGFCPRPGDQPIRAGKSERRSTLRCSTRCAPRRPSRSPAMLEDPPVLGGISGTPAVTRASASLREINSGTATKRCCFRDAIILGRHCRRRGINARLLVSSLATRQARYCRHSGDLKLGPRHFAGGSGRRSPGAVLEGRL